MMTKKIMMIALIVCSLCAINFNVSAAETEGRKTRRARKAGGFDRDRPNNFTSSMKKLGGYLLFYIPNRVIDATDIITADLNIGGGLIDQLVISTAGAVVLLFLMGTPGLLSHYV